MINIQNVKRKNTGEQKQHGGSKYNNIPWTNIKIAFMKPFINS